MFIIKNPFLIGFLKIFSVKINFLVVLFGTALVCDKISNPNQKYFLIFFLTIILVVTTVIMITIKTNNRMRENSTKSNRKFKIFKVSSFSRDLVEYILIKFYLISTKTWIINYHIWCRQKLIKKNFYKVKIIHKLFSICVVPLKVTLLSKIILLYKKNC